MGNEDKRLMASLAHLTWEDVRFSTSSPCSDDDIMVNDLEWVKWSAMKEVIDLSLHDCYSVKSNRLACCLVVSIIPASHMLRAWVGLKGHFLPSLSFPHHTCPVVHCLCLHQTSQPLRLLPLPPPRVLSHWASPHRPCQPHTWSPPTLLKLQGFHIKPASTTPSSTASTV